MATFGNTGIGSSGFSPNPNQICAGLFTAGPTSGTLQSISVYFPLFSKAANYQLAVYGATSGNLIGSTSSNSIPTSAQWATATTSGTLNDASGNYFICANIDTASSCNLSINTSGGTMKTLGETFGVWPGTVTLSSLASWLFSAYFTYAPSGSSPVNFIKAPTKMVIR